jgi:hypothetical protein
MFQFTGLAPIAWFPTFGREGCPIRKSPDQRLFAPPRSLSQLITSFFASKSLGIPHTPFITFFKVFIQKPIVFSYNINSFPSCQRTFRVCEWVCSVGVTPYYSHSSPHSGFACLSHLTLKYLKELFNRCFRMFRLYAVSFHSHSSHSLSLLIVENNGFEPLTLCVQGRCSSQLS